MTRTRLRLHILWLRVWLWARHVRRQPQTLYVLAAASALTGGWIIGRCSF